MHNISLQHIIGYTGIMWKLKSWKSLYHYLHLHVAGPLWNVTLTMGRPTDWSINYTYNHAYHHMSKRTNHCHFTLLTCIQMFMSGK